MFLSEGIAGIVYLLRGVVFPLGGCRRGCSRSR